MFGYESKCPIRPGLAESKRESGENYWIKLLALGRVSMVCMFRKSMTLNKIK